jgi:hypothetical protein
MVDYTSTYGDQFGSSQYGGPTVYGITPSPLPGFSTFPNFGVTTGGDVFTIFGTGIVNKGGNDLFSGSIIGGKWIVQTTGSGSVSQSNRLIARTGNTTGSKAGVMLYKSVIDTDISIKFKLKNRVKDFIPDSGVILAAYELFYDSSNYARIFLEYSPISTETLKTEEFKIIVEIKKVGIASVYLEQNISNSIFSELVGNSIPAIHKFSITRVGSRLIFRIDNSIIFDDKKGLNFLNSEEVYIKFYVDNLSSIYNVVTDFYDHRVNTLILFGEEPSLSTDMVSLNLIKGLTPSSPISCLVPMTRVTFPFFDRVFIQDFTYNFSNEFKLINQKNSYLSIVNNAIRNPFNTSRGLF